jgi:arylsulfatase A-like enzyme
MNIIQVVFDTLRRDCVGVHGQPGWGAVHTPNFQAFAAQSLVMTRAYPNVLPTLPARVALYSGQQVYPFKRGDIRLKGDFVGAAGWGPIPEEWPTLAETLSEAGYRTGLISDVLHMFKPSKNFWRGFDQWTFLRGRENDPARSGPRLTEAELAYWYPKEVQELLGVGTTILPEDERWMLNFINQIGMNQRGRHEEVDFFAPRVLQEACRWLEQNRDADNFFLAIESFDPHEPWVVPAHYRELYLKEPGPEQVITYYDNVPNMSDYLMRRTRANYRGSVTQCDRWFGHLMETLRVLGRLDDTLVILTADHGHTLGEDGYMGKRGYPSRPEVFANPLMVRFPGAQHAGQTSDQFVQHTDLTASILDAAGVTPQIPLDGQSFLASAAAGQPGPRDHVTVGWGSTPTVINDRWWFNCKVDGTGVFLHDLREAEPFARNVADDNRAVVDELFQVAKTDAGGSFPEWIIKLAKDEADAPGCSAMAARG